MSLIKDTERPRFEDKAHPEGEAKEKTKSESGGGSLVRPSQETFLNIETVN